MRFLLLFLAFAIGCGETATCPDGYAKRIGPDGHTTGDCIPLDGAMIPDAGPDTGTIADAGPCGACGGDTPHCDADQMRCVACLEDAHCTDPAQSHCVGGMCMGCDDSEQCGRAPFASLRACAPGAGCVECTATEDDACSGRACTTANVCSMFDSSQGACEPCDADANCGGGDMYCVPMRFDGADRAGGYCLKDFSTGCTQPLRIETPVRTTLSGETGMTFCGINEDLATCEAVLGLIENAPCDSGEDTECPQPGGICRRVSGVDNLCTYECNDPGQCLSPGVGRGHTCPVAASYCGG